MRDITSKQITLRKAKAIGFVSCTASSIQLIKDNALPKGNLFEIARTAGMLGAKQTQHLIPHCHPVAIDGLSIDFEIIEPGNTSDLLDIKKTHGVLITVTAQSIGRTGIEIEALTAASICGVTIYDVLKYVKDPDLEIMSVRLLEKSGGKTDRKRFIKNRQKAAVLVCSDSTAAGKREDKSGKLIEKMLKENNTEILEYKILPDEPEQIQKQILEWVDQDIPYIFTTGGTGLGPRDKTVEAVRGIIERDAHGITEAMRSYGQMRSPLAMMSRSVAGSINHSLVVTLPGSSNGVRESLEAILPAVFHARKMLRGGDH